MSAVKTCLSDLDRDKNSGKPAKLSHEPLAEYGYIENFDGEKRAISVTIRNFASGLLGKLESGDIVSVYVADYGDKKETLSPQELKYVEVLAVTLGTGYDIEETTSKEGEEKALPSTVTLKVNEEQAILLADLYLVLVLRCSLFGM